VCDYVFTALGLVTSAAPIVLRLPCHQGGALVLVPCAARLPDFAWEKSWGFVDRMGLKSLEKTKNSNSSFGRISGNDDVFALVDVKPQTDSVGLGFSLDQSAITLRSPANALSAPSNPVRLSTNPQLEDSR
jgi:hypothetical protein